MKNEKNKLVLDNKTESKNMTQQQRGGARGLATILFLEL